MITPKRSRNRAGSREPFTPPTNSGSPRESKALSREDLAAAMEPANTAADVNGRLDTFAIAQLRQFFELLQSLELRRSTGPGTGHKLDQNPPRESPAAMGAALKLETVQDKVVYTDCDPPTVGGMPIADAQAAETKKLPRTSLCQPVQVFERSTGETRG